MESAFEDYKIHFRTSKKINLITIMNCEFIPFTDLVRFYISVVVIANSIISIMSLSSNENFYHKTYENRSLLALNKNYCNKIDYRRNDKPLDLISSIIHEMQENADGKMSCVSIFANNDSFAEGMINIEDMFLKIFD